MDSSDAIFYPTPSELLWAKLMHELFGAYVEAWPSRARSSERLTSDEFAGLGQRMAVKPPVGTPERRVGGSRPHLDKEGIKPRRAASWSAMSMRNILVRSEGKATA